MSSTAFSKILSANDVGATGGHQAGILVPKTNNELLAFLPALDPAVKNPDAWIYCIDEGGTSRRFRFVYYNNALHDANGTRNEYRITYMTAYFRECGASTGDSLEISRDEEASHYRIWLIRKASTPSTREANEGESVRIRIRSAWSRLH